LSDAPPEPRATPAPPVEATPPPVGIPTSPGVEWVLDWLQVIAIAGVLAWAVMTYGVVRMRVPTGSMEPTIMPGDSFFVDKFTYLVGLNKPEPGDIIIPPAASATSSA